jgi:hypothetical protein
MLLQHVAMAGVESTADVHVMGRHQYNSRW